MLLDALEGAGEPWAGQILNTLIAMAATGLWHGAAWHFMAWGLYHAAGLLILRFYNLLISVHLKESFKHSIPVTVLSVALTFNFTAFGWILFVNGMDKSIHVIRVIFHV